MESVLRHLKALPGVFGALLSDCEGRVLACALPPGVGAEAPARAARALADGAAGLRADGVSVRTIDFRYGETRIVVRQLANASLLFLCARGMNLQALVMSAAVVAPRLERLLAGRGSTPAPALPPGRIHQIVQRIDAVIARRRLDRFKVRREIALRAGFALDFAEPDAIDDPASVARLAGAASEVLGELV